MSVLSSHRTQAGVMADVAQHVAHGGVLVLFPGARNGARRRALPLSCWLQQNVVSPPRVRSALRLRCAALQRGAARRGAARRCCRSTRARSQWRKPRARPSGRCCCPVQTSSRRQTHSPEASRRASARGWCSCARVWRQGLPTLRRQCWLRRAAPRCSASWMTCSLPSTRRLPRTHSRCCRAEAAASFCSRRFVDAPFLDVRRTWRVSQC